MADPNAMSIENKLEFFSETRHSYGRTALLLSGGATFGKFRFGLVKAIYELDLFPRIVCGSSVGSLVLGLMCSRPYKELPKVRTISGHKKNNIENTFVSIVLRSSIHVQAPNPGSLYNQPDLVYHRSTVW